TRLCLPQLLQLSLHSGLLRRPAQSSKILRELSRHRRDDQPVPGFGPEVLRDLVLERSAHVPNVEIVNFAVARLLQDVVNVPAQLLH
ncbi:hypothetical protein BDW22DRAFT_1364138, partial [Trametopsis cervina]